MSDLVNYLLEGVKNGERHIIFCEPLATFHLNLAFCPNRGECEALEEYIDQHICEPDTLYDLISNVCCPECPEDLWIIVTTTQGSIATFLVSPEVGEKVKRALEDYEKKVNA